MIEAALKSALDRSPHEADGAGFPCDIERTMDRILDLLMQYRPQADLALVRRAYVFAREKHEGQTRRSGEPYIIHPVEVTEVLADLEMDEQTLAAGLLHDVIEDCSVTAEEISHLFGPEVAHLVDGVTKLQIAGVDEGKKQRHARRRRVRHARHR